MVGVLALWVSVAMHDDAIVAFVDKVGAAADVVKPGRFAIPVLHGPGVRHEPHVAPVVLRKPLALGEHLADVLRLCHLGATLVVQLVVRVNHKAADAIPVSRSGKTEKITAHHF